jgi:hypothetical protein
MTFENALTTDPGGSFSAGIDMMYYRSMQSFPRWLICDGTSEWDKNQLGEQGYPCLDQPGHFFGDDRGADTLFGAYFWGNTKDSTQTDGMADALNQWEPRLRDYHVKPNRDFYNQEEPFTGATGVGVGALAARPVTCTTGVGYWATDQGSWNRLGDNGVFYKCTATNLWTLYYTPYSYPHPLQATQGDVTPSAAPTNLTATVR